MYIYIYIKYIYIYIYIYTHVYIIHIHTHTQTHTCMYTYNICIYTYIHMYAEPKLSSSQPWIRGFLLNKWREMTEFAGVASNFPPLPTQSSSELHILVFFENACIIFPPSSTWCSHHHQHGALTIISVVLSPSSAWCSHHHQRGALTIISVVLSPSSAWCSHHHQHMALKLRISCHGLLRFIYSAMRSHILYQISLAQVYT